MVFSYKTEITPDHFIELQELLWSKMRNETHVKRLHRNISLILLVSAAAFVVFAIDFVSSDPPFRQSFFLAVSVVSLVVWSLSARWHHAFAMRKWVSGSRTILGKVTLNISDTGILEVGSQHRSECRWDAVGEVIETANMIIFLTDSTKGFLCPKASVPDEEYHSLLAYSREQIAQPANAEP